MDIAPVKSDLKVRFDGMIYSRSSQYAIRALTYLSTQPPGYLCPLETIARSEGIPQHFLGKIMQRLVKKRVVRSVKGINGGFALRMHPEKITLFELADAIDDISLTLEECIFGHEACSDQKSCPLHSFWKEVKQKQIEFLQSITIADVAVANLRRNVEKGINPL